MNSTTSTPNPDANYILFARDVNQESITQLIQIVLSLQTQSPRLPTTLLLNSDGGNVFSGLQGYSILRSLNLNLTTVNVGSVDSIANALFLAGDKRICHSLSTFLWHGVGINQETPVRLDIPFLNSTIAKLTTDHRKIGSIVADRTNLALNSIIELFGADTVQDAQWAIDSGVVHEIVEPPFVPDNATVHQII